MDSNSESAEEAIKACIPRIESFLRNVIQYGRFDLTFSIHKNATPADDLEAPDYRVGSLRPGCRSGTGAARRTVERNRIRGAPGGTPAG